jgi:hypothetical protein
MIKAMIGGQRDPHILAGLARGRMKAKHDALVGLDLTPFCNPRN